MKLVEIIVIREAGLTTRRSRQ